MHETSSLNMLHPTLTQFSQNCILNQNLAKGKRTAKMQNSHQNALKLGQRRKYLKYNIQRVNIWRLKGKQIELVS